MSTSFGWTCTRCTYQHSAPGTRCVMCNELRVTKEQMRDFVMGKTLGKDDAKVNEAPSVKENRPPSPLTAKVTPKPAPAPQIRNPYARKVSTTNNTAVTAPVKPAPSNANQRSPFFSQSSRPNTGSTTNRQAQQQQRASWNPPRNLPTIRNNSVVNSSVSAAYTKQRGPTHEQQQSWCPLSDGAHPTNQQPLGQSNASGNENKGNNAKAPPKPAPAAPKNPFTLAMRPAPMPYVPGPVPLCAETASDWVYPVHESYPIRDYQLEISQTAVLYNTLVSLPTGLGKTLIASVVLYNYYRWFPTGKVIFLAPTLPLVNQQIKACYDIMGIPAEDTALLTGKVNGNDREVLWKERRVFFCTPQTVQRDIELNRCPANHVVCVVLDEAHKASGAYAYVKVVHYLDEAGAKFRILGLSATPGTGIKAIQEVITALRIQKIEARLEDDSNVKKYIHERHSEIIMVKQASVVNSIERMLIDLTAPILDRLRNGNGLAMVRGNATLTPWCVLRAQKEYKSRNNDTSLDSLFYAAHSLVQVRCEIRRTGIGMVRSKMLQLKNEPKGLMCSIVKGKEFQAVMDAVIQASADPDNVNETAEDRKLNNPKLMKLDEILTEHFERARACGNSSRAIVFTQWRDSVSEIVSVLAGNQPLLRARHFVGQGKSTGGANKDRIDQSCASLKGMKQKEQQAVIRQFREGIYNILVCTCIGEEGLDIGEVDLIVNYDSLRSPIRMIQRVGRTGRKRDGRVVCLVSEGQEENTMRQSKNAEKTLGRALKKPDSFSFVKSSPMFPQTPVLRKLDMSVVANDFHLSQLGGNAMVARVRNEPNEASRSDQYINWRLNEAQELQRLAMFGDLSFSTCLELQSSGGELPAALRKRLLRARTRSMSTYKSQRKAVPSSFGRSRLVLLKMVRKHGSDVDKKSLLKGGPRRESGALNRLFPLDRSAAETGSLHKGLLQLSLSATQTNRPLESDAVHRPRASASLPSEHLNTGLPENGIESTVPFCDTNMGKETSSDTSRPTVPQNPYDSQRMAMKKTSPVEHLPQVQDDVALQVVVQNTEVQENPSSNNVQTYSECLEADDPLRLYLPPDASSSSGESSSSSDEDDEESIEAINKVESNVQKPAKTQLKLERHESPAVPIAERASNTKEPTRSYALRLPDAPMDGAIQDELIPLELPAQDDSSLSSSDESSSDGEREKEEPSRIPAEIEINHAMTESNSNLHVPLKEDDGLPSKPPRDSYMEKLSVSEKELASSTQKMKSDSTSRIALILEGAPPVDENERVPAERPSLGSASSKSAANPLPVPRSSDDSGAELTDTPRVEATPLAGPTASTDSGADLFDTPQVQDAGRMLPPPRRLMSSHSSQRNDLRDDADDIVCSICYSGDSPDDNPIVLCDGPNNDLSCPIAVHKLCYSIYESLDAESWHCDTCAFRQGPHQKKKHSAIQCYICQKEDGPLKQMPDLADQWFHPYCQNTVVKQDSFCQYCALQGGTRCSSEGCHEYAHPHCGIELRKPWIVVAFVSSSISRTSNLCSDEVIGSNIYCADHREQVWQCLVRAGAISLTSPRYVIVSSKLRGLNNGTAPTEGAVRKRLRKKSSDTGASEVARRPAQVAAAKSTNKGVDSIDLREQKRQRLLQRINEKNNCRFLDLEAEDDSDEGDDEEDEARRIEEEEAFDNSFINDSSQLGSMTQDELGRLSLNENSETPDESGTVHRRVDMMRERSNQFATPVFNRRMLKHARGKERADTSQAWDQPTPDSSEPSSSKGLGAMHFVRSVMEHLGNGGDADEIEAMYHTVAQDASPQRNPAGPIIMDHVPPSDSSDDEEEEHRKPPATGGLTEKMRARMERNRQEALRRRHQRQSQNNTS